MQIPSSDRSRNFDDRKFEAARARARVAVYADDADDAIYADNRAFRWRNAFSRWRAIATDFRNYARIYPAICDRRLFDDISLEMRGCLWCFSRLRLSPRCREGARRGAKRRA